MKQLVAEQLVTIRTKRGFTRLEWRKIRERNEALDCRVYARAAAWIAGADRWSEAMWRDLERQVAVPAPSDREPDADHGAIGEDSEPDLPAEPSAGVLRRRRIPRGRRVFRSSYLS
jgi:phage terminase large subunit GpA-like protein